MVSAELFGPYRLGPIELKNRVVMAPMTRSRSAGNIPGEIVARYYAQRASAGLIITEGTAPSPDALGYARIPGAYSEEQKQGWRGVAEAVHAAGGRIFVQLMHTGRVGHPLNLPAGAVVRGPTAKPLSGEIYTDASGMQPYAVPQAMSQADIDRAVQEFARAAAVAVEAGIDGIELHGANGYLLDQFLNANINDRDDAYGRDAGARNRLTLEVARAVAGAIGADRTGIRLSPYGVFNDSGAFAGIDAQYEALSKELSALGLVYIHLVDHSAMGAPKPPQSLVQSIRQNFKGTLILSGGYDRKRAEEDLQGGRGDLIAFGRPWLANPDLLERLKTGAAWNEPDAATFYTPGEKGYLDYPVLSAAAR
ncbi:MAG: alkene reductase [Leptospirales bacterium]|nr:alkene reductase [Leptospirales bacterium]